MKLDEYQTAAAVFKFDAPDDPGHWALGMCGEAGETADLVKKWRFRGRQIDMEELKLEIGDTLWYLAALAGAAGMSLSEVAEANLAKLTRRHSGSLMGLALQPVAGGSTHVVVAIDYQNGVITTQLDRPTITLGED